MDRKNGLENYYVIKNQKKLRMGYTTGSCAAGAAKAAARMLLTGKEIGEIRLLTPKGIQLYLALEDVRIEKDRVICAVRKDGGDDPDATNGALIYAAVTKTLEPGIDIRGGIGVGVVTKKGLDQPVGCPAINRTPRAMINSELEEISIQEDYEGGFQVVISVPEGENLAQKTFNPRLGITGGISILGTTGIVEPMSEAALKESIRIEIRTHTENGEKYLLVTPGNYGEAYLKEHMALPFEKNIQCSNYVGSAIDMSVEAGAEGILFVAHIGKFVKVGAGIMNTHSHCADGRMEILASNAIRAGASLEAARKVLECNTTDEGLEVLKEAGILEKTMEVLMEKIQFYLDHRSYEQMTLGAVVFSNVHGYLGQTKDAAKLIKCLRKREEKENEK